MQRLAVIYVFRHPRGWVYVGKHTPRVGHDPRQWPRRGRGALPDGYTGAGKAWLNVVRKHGIENCEHRVLRVLPDSRAAWEPAEQRARRLASAVFGERCVNIMDGGQGYTSIEASAAMQRFWSDPDRKREWSIRARAQWSDPELKAQFALINKERWKDPAYRERMLPMLAAAGLRGSRKGNEAQAARAGYPSKKVLGVLRRHRRGLSAADIAVKLDWPADTRRVRGTIKNLRMAGHNIVSTRGRGRGAPGLFQLVE